ncbi:LysR family transcriptional regulator [Bdellovibrio sp. NC01]|uniref:LysR family transcriptional regulator n=1 Tax=Bdellovibrio sp. NC01 TaxID=2220073 RepID=UPI00143CC775|nr:LysR family transcriptional regulator [Bdellovibrio sp. NC01]
MTKYPRHLIESFMTFATERNVVKTANTLGISQPALSRHLQQLEELVGEKLFQKQGRQKTLSPIGHELFARIQPTWQNYDAIVDGVVSKFSIEPQQPVKIYGPAELLSRTAANLTFPHPLIFTPTRSGTVSENVAKDEIAIGITRVVPDNLQVSARVLFKEGFQIIYPAKWKIATPATERQLMQKLNSYPILAYGEDFSFPEEAWSKYKLEGQPQILRVLQNWEVLQTWVENGLGWAVAPANLLRKSSKIMATPASNDLAPHVSYHLLYKKDLIRIPWFKVLVNEILETYKST